MTISSAVRWVCMTAVSTATAALGQTRAADVTFPSVHFVFDPALAAKVPAPSPDMDVAHALPYWVALGNWKQVAQILTSLPPQEAARLHLQIVQGLVITANNPVSAPVPAGSDPLNRAGVTDKAISAGPPILLGALLHPEDVLELADALPASCSMQSATATGLGQLLAKTIEPTGLPDGFMQRLHAGTIHLGGSGGDHIVVTAVFLLSAGQPELAQTFLPDEKAAVDSDSPALMAVYQKCLLAVADKSDTTHDLATATSARQAALRVTIAMLGKPLPPSTSEALVKRAVDLSQRIGDLHIADAWLSDLINRHDARLGNILTDLAMPISPAGGQANYDARVFALTEQRHIADLLSTSTNAAPYDPNVRVALRLFALNWATEADLTRSRLLLVPHEITLGDARTFKPTFAISPTLVKEMAPELLLQWAPTDGWSSAITPDDRARFDNDRLALLMGSGRRADGMELLISMARWDSSGLADQKVAGDALTIWVLQNMPLRITVNPLIRPPLPKGIPTARATQVRNLDAFVEMLGQIEHAYGRNLSGPLLMPLFDEIHSQAEVYTLAEIQRVFGAIEDLDTATLTQLIGLMQENLSKAWQSDQVQTANGTNRTDDQRKHQVLEGYHTLTTCLERKLSKQSDWRLYTALAGARFQEAEIGLSNGNGFAPYTSLRDSGFDAIHRAAAEYAKGVSDQQTGSETINVYSDWFAMALGATDLSSLDVNVPPLHSELEQLREAIHALPGAAAERHADRFASTLVDQEPKFAPDVKQRIVSSGLIVAGDTPLANPLRVLMQSYADLLTELQFKVAVDGSAQIGHKTPFGLMVSLDHTDSLEAEMGSFGKYILAPDQGSPWADSRRVGVNYRENFQQHLMAALGNSFEVQNIVWAPVDVRSRPTSGATGRAGWSNTPLVYIVAKARGASVDRVPPMQMDVDFNDRMNMVILPVTSSLLMVDAGGDSTPAITDVTVDQRLNDHDLGTGVLKLEVLASGRGLMPELDKLINLAAIGRFNIQGVVDAGLKVDRFDANPDDSKLAPAIVSQRHWTISLAAMDSMSGEVHFAFPPLAVALANRSDVTATYHRYADADVVEAGPSVLLHGISVPSHRPNWLIWAIPFILLGGAAIVFRLFRRTRQIASVPQSVVSEPTSLFSTLDLLKNRRLRGALAAQEADELNHDIRELEARYFAPGSNAAPAGGVDQRLKMINSRWA